MMPIEIAEIEDPDLDALLLHLSLPVIQHFNVEHLCKVHHHNGADNVMHNFFVK